MTTLPVQELNLTMFLDTASGPARITGLKWCSGDDQGLIRIDLVFMNDCVTSDGTGSMILHPHFRIPMFIGSSEAQGGSVAAKRNFQVE